MKCPRCVQLIHRGAASCPHCGFSLAEADGRYGSEQVRMRRLEDAAGLMRRGDLARVEGAMDRFERRFPQLLFAVYTGTSEGHGDPRQFGFWLLNRAVFEDVGVERLSEWTILLTLDPERKSAAFHWGYRLDPFLEEEDGFVALSRAHAYWMEASYADGIIRAIEQLTARLKWRSRQARWDPERFERRVGIHHGGRSMLRRLREGHRKSRKEGVAP